MRASFLSWNLSLTLPFSLYWLVPRFLSFGEPRAGAARFALTDTAAYNAHYTAAKVHTAKGYVFTSM